MIDLEYALKLASVNLAWKPTLTKNQSKAGSSLKICQLESIFSSAGRAVESVENSRRVQGYRGIRQDWRPPPSDCS
jgi:hypothetical protein